MKIICTILTFNLISLILYANTEDTPKLKITQILINDKPVVDTSGVLRLKTNDDDLEFFFDAPNADSAVFSYQLIGFDTKIKTTPHPTTRYTQLKGGTYTFNLRLDKNDSIVVSRKLIVDKPIEEESWFKPSLLVYVLLIVGAIAFFWHIYNLRQKLKVQTIRNNIAADLHDEVGATLSSIGMSIRTIQKRLGKNAPEVAEILQKMKMVSDETNHNLRDTVWAINPENDSFNQVFDRMSSFAYQILGDNEIQCVITNEVDMNKPFKITMEQRRNVYLIFKEAVNNIAKHSEATKTIIKMKQEKEGIRLTIDDNGKGFDMTDKYDGNGLKNYRRRAKESFIEFDMTSTPSVGTRISMLIPEL